MKTLVVLKNGAVKISGNGEIKPDGTVRVMGQPIVLRSECEKAGLDPVPGKSGGWLPQSRGTTQRNK